MRLIAKAYDIDDCDIDMIEQCTISAISEDLEVRCDIPFKFLEKESQMALVSKIFERLKNDIEEEVF